MDGLEEAMKAGEAGTFYNLPGALNMQKDLDRFTEGKLTLNIADMPIKCPVAPIEFVFLADYYFHKRSIRDRVSIELVTPLAGAFTKPAATAVLTKIASEKGIDIRPDFAISEVDSKNRVINSFDGKSAEYDYLVSIPPNVGPAGNRRLRAGQRNGVRSHRSTYIKGDKSRAYLRNRRQYRCPHFEGGVGGAL